MAATVRKGEADADLRALLAALGRENEKRRWYERVTGGAAGAGHVDDAIAALVQDAGAATRLVESLPPAAQVSLALICEVSSEGHGTGHGVVEQDVGP